MSDEEAEPLIDAETDPELIGLDTGPWYHGDRVAAAVRLLRKRVTGCCQEAHLEEWDYPELEDAIQRQIKEAFDDVVDDAEVRE